MTDHKTVTVSDDVYNRFHETFQKLRKNGTLPHYVVSMSEFLTYSLNKKEEETRKLHRIASQIKTIPEEFLEIKIKVSGGRKK